MAGLLNRTAPTTTTAFWAVDKVILVYIAFTTILIVGWWSAVPQAAGLLILHIVSVGVLLVEVKRPNPTSWVFRNWYPLLYVASSYREMAVLIPAVRRSDSDQWLADVDFRFWHANPTVWLERIHTPALTEFLQIVYTLFVPVVLLVAFALWRTGKYERFQYYAFLIALGFLTSYIGYLIVPARGPRFLLENFQHIPLQGLWFFRNMQSALDKLETAHHDCFPSGHTELTILACWGSRWLGKRVFRVYFAYTLCIIFATVYLRYHYTVDLLAGALLAVALIVFAPKLFRNLSKGDVAIGGC